MAFDQRDLLDNKTAPSVYKVGSLPNNVRDNNDGTYSKLIDGEWILMKKVTKSLAYILKNINEPKKK